MSGPVSLVFRAVLALFLTIVFYCLAVSTGIGLLYLAYAHCTYGHQFHLGFFLACSFGGIMVLWAIVPRTAEFEVPGPRLTPDSAPRLFEEIGAVAAAMKEERPAAVYLLPEANAWVQQIGGILGFGSSRVMGIGLPLIQALTVNQLRAVLAHEFGHYQSGDTLLGPWIHDTRLAMFRTVVALGRGDIFVSVLRLPFVFYTKMFFRITNAVSRHQEYAADRVAARTVGPQHLSEGLRKVAIGDLGFNAYWQQEVLPVLNAGYHPPISEGFRLFLASDEVARGLERTVESTLSTAKQDPYNTHPLLKDRIAALADLPKSAPTPADPGAATLLDDQPDMEEKLLARVWGVASSKALKPISWADVGPKVYVPVWRKLVEENSAGIEGITPVAIPSAASDIARFTQNFARATAKVDDAVDRAGFASTTLGAALTLLFVEQKRWRLLCEPGSVRVTDGVRVIEPFRVMEQLASKSLSADTWRRLCAELGLSNVNLAGAVHGANAHFRFHL